MSPTYDPAILGTVTPDTKTLVLESRIAAYEQRDIALAIASADFPAGTYKLSLQFGGRTVALSALAEYEGTLAGTLDLATTETASIFRTLPVARVSVRAYLWDESGKVLWASGLVDLYRNDQAAEAVTPAPSASGVASGRVAVTEDERTVSVDLSAYGLGASPAIVASVIVPDGGINLFVVAIVFDSGTQTATITLNTDAPATGYEVAWMVPR